MRPEVDREYIAFAGAQKIAGGPALEIAPKIRMFMDSNADAEILVFDAKTSAQIEFDLRGTPDQIRRRLKDQFEAIVVSPGPGRPKLGVVCREISLLPRHWEWLATQRGGASATLRRLVEDAKRQNAPQDQLRAAKDAAYKFLSIIAGNLPSYEEAIRALYGDAADKYQKIVKEWPKDIRDHAYALANQAWGCESIEV